MGSGANVKGTVHASEEAVVLTGEREVKHCGGQTPMKMGKTPQRRLKDKNGYENAFTLELALKTH